MNYIVFSIKLLTYLVILGVSFLLFEKRGEINSEYSNIKQNETNNNIENMLIIAILIGGYSLICSASPYSMDRENYAYYFSKGVTGSMTIALNVIAELLHVLTYDEDIFFFFISFLTTIIFFVAYLLYGEIKGNAVLIIGCSQCYIYSFYLLKQAPSMALASVAIFAAFHKRYGVALGALIASIMFHEAAIVLIPLGILLAFAEKKPVRIFIYICSIMAILLFAPLTATLITIISELLPSLFIQIEGYVNENGNLVQEFYLMTIIKGIPYYLICFYAIIKRSTLYKKIKYYDKFLLMSVFASVATILSAYMYWMWRFGAYFYFPVLIFAYEIIQCMESKKKRIFSYVGLCGILLFLTFRYLYQIFFLYGGF